MAIDHESFHLARPQSTESVGFVRRMLRELTVQDLLVFVFLVTLTVVALRCPPSQDQRISVTRMGSLLTFLVATLILVRGGLLKHGFMAPLLYRLAIYGTVQLSYFFLARLLPLVNPTTLDHELYQLDLQLFGFEPALAMDAIVTPATTEWFAFFYFGYFFVLAIHVIPTLLFSRSARQIGEFALGMVSIFCVGHLVYMLVPGYGPHRALADQFQNPLPHGMWRDMVMATVASGGSQMDIFPSLHTAAPTFLALYSFRHRDKLPFKASWPVTAFCAVNIVGATMFLRWHYVIDVIAGLALATFSFLIATRITGWELDRRAAAGLSESWPRFRRGQVR
ncbi:MAG: phosphatase PAP2 family protein [Myxococcales bacterium]|nr:phosphatase PAP2 family protein [Myxococcales bacterium]